MEKAWSVFCRKLSPAGYELTIGAAQVNAKIIVCGSSFPGEDSLPLMGSDIKVLLEMKCPVDGSSLFCQVSNTERSRCCKTPGVTTVPATLVVALTQVSDFPPSPTSPSNPILQRSRLLSSLANPRCRWRPQARVPWAKAECLSALNCSPLPVVSPPAVFCLF